MKTASRLGVMALMAATAWAQSASPQQSPARRKSATRRQVAQPAVTQRDVQALKDALAQQQQQIQQLQQQLQQRDQTWQDAQQRLQQLQTTTSEAQAKAAAVETAASEQKTAVDQLQSNVKDVQTTLTNTAVQAQEEQKRAKALEGLVGRFRFSGDIRVRNENFFLANTPDRIRGRIRARFGVESSLNQDFTAGMSFATGLATDPTSTNETLTAAFERKNFMLDRAYVIYQPQAHKWLQLTGGKFAFTWARTEQTFDTDLNPEGFSQKLSFNTNNSVVKNVTFNGLQLLYNEVSGGADSFAVGSQASTKLQFGKRISLTPAYTILNWRNANALLGGIGSVVPATGTGARAGSTGTILPFANGQTNATATAPDGSTVFVSRFLYSDLLLDLTVDTGITGFPLRVLGEYENNLNAEKVSAVLGKQSHLYLGQIYFGQLKKQKDLQFGYGFWRQEQDSVLAAFTFSDQRAPTNIVQHFLQGQYLVRDNVTLSATLLVGRTLNSSLPNAVLTTGYPAGTVQPYLKRMQFDVIYKF